MALQDALGDTENGDSVSVNFFGDGTANNGAPMQAVCCVAPSGHVVCSGCFGPLEQLPACTHLRKAAALAEVA